jgi:hypothetical protein
MKKLFLRSLLTLSFLGSAYGSGNNVSVTVLESFNIEIGVKTSFLKEVEYNKISRINYRNGHPNTYGKVTIKEDVLDIGPDEVITRENYDGSHLLKTEDGACEINFYIDSGAVIMAVYNKTENNGKSSLDKCVNRIVSELNMEQTIYFNTSGYIAPRRKY